jgi:integrase/recombinase XerD
MVTLRKRKNADGTTSLFLDIHYNGKRSYEFLPLCKLVKPSSPLDRQHNIDKKRLAEEIRHKREQQIQSDEYQVAPKFKRDIDFIKLFENYLLRYTKKDKRIVAGCFLQLKSFLKAEGYKTASVKQINAKFLNEFKEHLEYNLNGETPANYLKKFKRFLKSCMIDKIIPASLALELKDITIATAGRGIKKDILTFEEIQLLADTPITNEEVKRAFLFSCLTGLRFCDIVNLKWKDIHGKRLQIVQQKTGVDVTINLNQSAINILGKSSNAFDFIFSLPSHTACTKGLKHWTKKAGLTKNITWHCARHSFATGIINYGSDVKNASALLGHTSLTYTNRYVREVERLKETAVDNLPAIALT